MNRFDNNTIAIVFVGIITLVGVWTQQTEITTAGMGALAGFVTSKTIDYIEKK